MTQALQQSASQPRTADDQRIKVVVIESESERRAALWMLLQGTPGFTCAGAFATAEEAIGQAPELLPHIILISTDLPGFPACQCIRALKPRLPAARVLALSPSGEPGGVFAALRAGSNACLLSQTAPAELLGAIRELHGGGAPISAAIARQIVETFHEPAGDHHGPASLSRREQQIATLLARGLLYKEIAGELNLSLGTVRTYVRRVYQKLRVRSRAEAMLKLLPSAHRTSGGSGSL